MSFTKYLYISLALSFWIMFTYLGWFPNNVCAYHMSVKCVAFQIPSLVVMSVLAY